MRIGYLIGGLNTGGSERQLSELAIGMTAQGHSVEIACYDGPGVLDAYVEARGVVLRRMTAGSKIDKLRNVKKWIVTFNPDILHGFMKRASALAVLANLPKRRRKVIASDLSTAAYSRHKPVLWLALVLFHLADKVMTQTEVNKRSLIKLAPLLKRKVMIIRNGVDSKRFYPASHNSRNVFQFLCVGSVTPLKNPLNVIEAARILRDRNGQSFRLHWCGRYDKSTTGKLSDLYRSAVDLIERYRLQGTVSFQGEVSRIEKAYHSSDALLHASHQEGIPNAVVEGMACGLPVVVSRVSDLPLLLERGRNGFLCDSNSASSIATSMERMLKVQENERSAMGERSREMAVTWFGMDRFINEYERMYASMLSEKV
ncbi:glycosyltransferase [Acidobacteriota bacterium]